MRKLHALFAIWTFCILSFTIACSSDSTSEIIDPNENNSNNKKDVTSTTGIDQFNTTNIYSFNTMLLDDYAMQGFDIDTDGSIWYTQSSKNKQQLNWIKASPNNTTNSVTAQTAYIKLMYLHELLYYTKHPTTQY